MSKRAPIQLDTSAKFGPWSAASASAGAALAATSITDWVDSPVSHVPLGAFVLGVVVGGATLLRGLARSAAVWRALCLWAAGGWSLWARTHEEALPFGTKHVTWWANAENWYLAIVLMVVGGATAGTMAFRERRAGDRAAAAARKAAEKEEKRDGNRNAIAQKFKIALAITNGVGSYENRIDPETGKVLINQVTNKPFKKLVDGAVIRGVKPWPVLHGRSHGYTIDGDLPPGMTYQRISDLPALASYLGLPRGCGVEVEEGNTGRNSFIARVQTHDAFIHNYPYPEELVRPHSVNDDTPTGVKLDGTVGMLPMRWDNLTLAGEPDAGKSNTTHVLGLFDATAYDGALIDIDLSKSLSRPYIEPWFRAQLSGDPARMEAVPAPAVALTCPNRAVAWLVSECLLDAVALRKSVYGHLMRNMKFRAARGPEDGGLALLRFRVDEGGAFGDGEQISNLIRANYAQISGQGRPANIRTLWGGLRGVDEFIPTNVSALSPLRIALRPRKAQELGLYLGWSDFPDMDRAKNKGQGYVKIGEDSPWVQRFFMLGDGTEEGVSVEDQVAHIAEVCAPWQPELEKDEALMQAFNQPRVIDVDEAIAFFKGKIGVTENEDGTLTIVDFWTNRWEIVLPEVFPNEYKNNPQLQPAAAGATTTTAPVARSNRGGTGMKDLETNTRALGQDMSALANAASDLDAACREAARREAEGLPSEYNLLAAGEFGDGAPAEAVSDDGGDLGGDDDEIQRLNAQLAAPAYVPEHERPDDEPEKPKAQAPSPKEQTVLMLRIIKAAGGDGILAGKVRSQLNAVVDRFGIEVSEQVFYGRIKKLSDPGFITQPWGAGPGAEPKGRWTITTAGEAWLSMNDQN